jgi:hydrogenase maturation protease
VGPLRPGSLLVVGFGNVLAGDDAAGPAAMDLLRELRPPPGCRVEDGGCDALGLGGLWQGEPDVWLVDALARGAAPGTVHRLAHEEVLALPPRHGSAHQLSLPECLRCLPLAFPDMAGVRYRLWGVEPRRIGPPAGLSPAVAAAVKAVAGEIHRATIAATVQAPSRNDPGRGMATLDTVLRRA